MGFTVFTTVVHERMGRVLANYYQAKTYTLERSKIFDGQPITCSRRFSFATRKSLGDAISVDRTLISLSASSPTREKFDGFS
jgi:hypothetical protein